MPWVDPATGEASDECPSCADLAAALQGAERNLRGANIRIAKLMGDADQKRREYEHREDVEKLFAYWRKICGHPKARIIRGDKTYDPDRFDALKRSLETYGLRNTAYAILGASKFAAERKGRRFDDLAEHILDRAFNTERFLAHGRRMAGVPSYDEVGRE